MDRIKEVLQDSFQVPVTEEGGKLIVSYGALKRVEASIVDKKLLVDTTPNLNIPDEEILETNRRFRKFLDDATGYTAKQRVSKAKKDVGK